MAKKDPVKPDKKYTLLILTVLFIPFAVWANGEIIALRERVTKTETFNEVIIKRLDTIDKKIDDNRKEIILEIRSKR